MHIANCTVSQLAAPPLSPAGSMWDGLVPSIGGGSGTTGTLGQQTTVENEKLVQHHLTLCSPAFLVW